MSSSLTKADYSKILEYYGEQVPSSLAELKKSAEAILSLKLCRCIKKVSPENEPKAIGICTKNIFNTGDKTHPDRFRGRQHRNLIIAASSRSSWVPRKSGF